MNKETRLWLIIFALIGINIAWILEEIFYAICKNNFKKALTGETISVIEMKAVNEKEPS